MYSIPLTAVGIDKLRSDFQLWAYDPLAVASGQVYYQQISGKYSFNAFLLWYLHIYL